MLSVPLNEFAAMHIFYYNWGLETFYNLILHNREESKIKHSVEAKALDEWTERKIVNSVALLNKRDLVVASIKVSLTM